MVDEDGSIKANGEHVLTNYTTQLVTTDPESALTDSEALPTELTTARIAALGEGTHGTREFFRLKHRLIRHLVVEHGFRAICFEADFAASLAIDQYIRHGVGDPREALQDLHLWPWAVESVLELLEWLQSFNQGRSDKVRFVGIDVQYTTGSVSWLRELLDRVAPTFLAEIEPALDAMDDEGMPATTAGTPPMDFDQAQSALPEIRSQLASLEEMLSAEERTVAEQHLTVIEQGLAYRKELATLATERDDATARAWLLEYRDQAMAETVDWVLEHLADRVVLWAHDAHINREKQVIRGTDIQAPSMGALLADRWADDYYAVGFTFGRGSFQALQSVGSDDDSTTQYKLAKQELDGPLPGTIEASLDRLDQRVAVVDLRSASGNADCAAWLAEPRDRFSVGATYDEPDPAHYRTSYRFDRAFDALVYVDRTHRARPLERDT